MNLFGFWRAHRPAPSYARQPAAVSRAEQDERNAWRLRVLAGVGEQEPVWQVMLSLADEQARNEAESALAPDLDDAARQYNAGRAAAASDWAYALRDLRAKASAAPPAGGGGQRASG